MAITYKRGSMEALTVHFAKHEFDCKCGCATTKHDPALSAGLEKIRTEIGAPMVINSGYRCPAHNRRVGGSSASKHTTGTAVDVRCDAVNPVLLGIVARKYFKGVGIYWYGNTAFIHVDTRAIKATWLKSLSGESYRYTTLNSFILPTVRKGSGGAANKAAIRMLQRLLGITADGVFGVGTERALKEAQKKAGIAADGICGPESWKHISGAYRYL